MVHTCLLEQLKPHHHNLSAGFIANYMYPLIVDNPSYEPKSIICVVEEEFKYKISYNKAYRAKQKALEMRWGRMKLRIIICRHCCRPYVLEILVTTTT